MILDNLATHTDAGRPDVLIAHRTVCLHFTPTDWPWFNQVELGIAKIERGRSLEASSPRSLISRRLRHLLCETFSAGYSVARLRRDSDGRLGDDGVAKGLATRRSA